MSVYKIKKFVSFYDTDAMGVVHHANYLRYFEDARVSWYRDSGIGHLRSGENPLILAVLETSCKHKRPARFDEEIEIHVQVRQEGSKVRFQYAIYRVNDQELLATGMTLHVPVDSQMRVCKPPQKLKELLERETWIETWP